MFLSMRRTCVQRRNAKRYEKKDDATPATKGNARSADSKGSKKRSGKPSSEANAASEASNKKRPRKSK